MTTDTYTAELSHGMLMTLAQAAANQIHGLVVSMHLRRVGHMTHHENRAYDRAQVAALRRLLRSLRNPTDSTCSPAYEFRGFVKYYLDRLFTEKATERRWQNYVAKVAACNRVPCPAAGSPDWATFVLRERSAA